MHLACRLDISSHSPATCRYICCGRRDRSSWAPLSCHRAWTARNKSCTAPSPSLYPSSSSKSSAGSIIFKMQIGLLIRILRSTPPGQAAPRTSCRLDCESSDRPTSYFLQWPARASHLLSSGFPKASGLQCEQLSCCPSLTEALCPGLAFSLR